jgi:uncharacterized protein YggE
MRRFLQAGGVCLALAAGAVAPAASAQMASAPAGEAAFRATTLNLSAFGEEKRAPDIATINLGVATEAATARAAMQANAARMTQVLASLRAGGIAAKDVQTAQISLEPRYDYAPNQSPKLTGYRAANQVRITVRDLAKLGGAVDAAVDAGANEAGQISFGLVDPAAAEDAAREAAVKALAARAELYAKATGYRVVRLVSLTEGGGFTPPQPIRMTAMAARMESAETPVAPGEVQVRIDVSGVYELAR